MRCGAATGFPGNKDVNIMYNSFVCWVWLLGNFDSWNLMFYFWNEQLVRATEIQWIDCHNLWNLERGQQIFPKYGTLCLFSRNVSSTFSFHTLLFIGPLQKEVRCASSKTFQYHILQKKGTSENSSLRFPINHCYLRPSQYNQKIQLAPETRYTKIQ